jgi:hypothetical protein
MKVKNDLSLTTGLYIGGGIILYAYVLKPILNKLGITKSVDDRANEAATSNPAFDPTFFKGAKYILTGAAATKQAKAINDAWVWYHKNLDGSYNNAPAVFTVYRELKNKAQMSQVAAAYALLYAIDLYSDLYKKLSTDDFARLLVIINSKSDK